MTTNTFYHVWRNNQLKDLIRVKINDGGVIHIDLAHLNSYSAYLSSIKESSRNWNSNIFIKLEIKNKEQFIQYLAHPFRNLINFLYFTDVVDVSFLPLEIAPQVEREEEEEGEENINREERVRYKIRFDCSLIPESVEKLSVFVQDDTICSGKLPESITALDIYQSSIIQLNSSFVKHVLRDLPSRLKSLSLPNDFVFTTVYPKYSFPETLVDFHYTSTDDNLENFDSAKVLNKCQLRVHKLEALRWVQDNPWIVDLDLFIVPVSEKDPPIPLHITHLTTNVTIVNFDLLPPGLEFLRCIGNMTILTTRQLPFLKRLSLDSYKYQLNKNVVPRTLEDLEIIMYNEPLEEGILPSGLKTLCLENFDQDLQVGILPFSLTKLQLYKFKKLLKPSVLPNGLKELFLYEFNNCETNLLQHTLPPSLTSLSLNSYTGSFENIGPLNNLSRLSIHSLQPSLSKLLSNVVNIKLSFYNLESTNCSKSKKSKKSKKSSKSSKSKSVPATFLANTTIQNLVLSYTPTTIQSFGTKFNLYPEFLPFRLVKLETIGVEIHSAELIPSSCIFLKTDINGLNRDFVSNSVKY
ncbi:hypothetical protein CYY_008143 [Polysphondylium violaceum]|uniref:Uncharacterized protein n=1 Tax=Polysphondylium violaceum TaxID=133409 RepID=A0A8J4PNR4_9MYCE|nr:hypothetical protein CYY_008143 [Polysphondylium violaceum]